MPLNECKNVCNQYKIKIYGKNSFKGNCYCTRCSCWMLLSILTEKGNCPCCNHRPRTKKRYTRTKEVKRY